MAIGSQTPLNVSQRDLNEPSGLVRLGLQYISTGLPGGDQALAESILDTYNEHELIAALTAAASYSIGLASGYAGIPAQTLVGGIIDRIPGSIQI